jgi:hypothetical protein
METAKPIQPCSPCTALMRHTPQPLQQDLGWFELPVAWDGRIRTLPAPGHTLLRGACVLTSCSCGGVVFLVQMSL